MGTLLRFVLRRNRRDCRLLLRLWGGGDWLRSLLRNLARWRGRLLRHSWLYRCRRGWARSINRGFLRAFGKGLDIGSWHSIGRDLSPVRFGCRCVLCNWWGLWSRNRRRRALGRAGRRRSGIRSARRLACCRNGILTWLIWNRRQSLRQYIHGSRRRSLSYCCSPLFFPGNHQHFFQLALVGVRPNANIEKHFRSGRDLAHGSNRQTFGEYLISATC